MATFDLHDKQATFTANFAPIPLEYVPEGVQVIEDVPYGPHDLQKVDVYLPESASPTPVLIEIHGGGWRNGDKRQLGVYKGLIEKVLEAGIAVVGINYRLTPGFCWPTQAEDSVRSIQFVRSKAEEWNLDRSRVVLIGGSAGAQLSVWIAMHDDFAKPQSTDLVERQSSRVSGAIDCWGPMDLVHISLEGKAEAIFTQLFRCKPEEWDSPRVRRLRVDASPATYIQPGGPPVLIIHDQAEKPLPDDPKWTISDGHSSIWGVLLRSRLEEAGIPVECLFGATPETWTPSAVRFLRRCFAANKKT